MEMSESITKVSAALVQAQTEMRNPYNSADNPFFKSHYAPLDAILSLVRPILAKNGLLIMQSTGGDGSYASVTTTVLHSSGEYIRSDPLILRPSKLDPQGIGSALTYARRYSLSAILGIAGDDDDDANSISVAPPKAAAAPKPAAKPAGDACPTCSGPLEYLRDSEFEGKPIKVCKCPTCKKVVKVAK
jgi:hypothetical protein